MRHWPPTRVLQLTNMVNVEVDLDEAGAYQDLLVELDIKEECGNFGTLLSCTVPRAGEIGAGTVFLECVREREGRADAAARPYFFASASNFARLSRRYADLASSARAKKGLEGRTFAGNLVGVTYVDEDKRPTPAGLPPAPAPHILPAPAGPPPAPAPGDLTSPRACAACSAVLPASSFSKKQLKRRENATCKPCIEAALSAEAALAAEKKAALAEKKAALSAPRPCAQCKVSKAKDAYTAANWKSSGVCNSCNPPPGPRPCAKCGASKDRSGYQNQNQWKKARLVPTQGTCAACMPPPPPPRPKPKLPPPCDGQVITYTGAYEEEWVDAWSDATGVVVAEGVKHVGYRAFMECSKLGSTGFLRGTEVESVGEEAFRGSGVVDLLGMGGVRQIDDLAFAQCDELLTLEGLAPDLGWGRSRMGDNCFAHCHSLRSLKHWPPSMTYIPEGTFQDCRSLTTVGCDLSNVTSIGGNAFLDCTSLLPPELCEYDEYGENSDAILAHLKRKFREEIAARVAARYAIYASALVARKREREERTEESPSELAFSIARLPPDMARVIVEFAHGVVPRPKPALSLT
jgi:hypothetical protein